MTKYEPNGIACLDCIRLDDLTEAAFEKYNAFVLPELTKRIQERANDTGTTS